MDIGIIFASWAKSTHFVSASGLIILLLILHCGFRNNGCSAFVDWNDSTQVVGMKCQLTVLFVSLIVYSVAMLKSGLTEVWSLDT